MKLFKKWDLTILETFCLIALIIVIFFAHFSKAYPSDFTNYINQPVKTTDDKKELRIEWNNFFGFDMFKGYFAIKDLEDSFREYTAINLGQFKGRLKIGSDYKQIEYKFKVEF